MKNDIVEKLDDKNIKVVCFDEIDSTSTFLKQQLNCGETGHVLAVAKKQTAGRGRNGKSFYSPENTGLYMSVLLHPNCRIADAVGITTCVSVVVARAIEKVTGKSVGIKWVNDLYAENKKVCGILCEAVNDYKQGTTKSVIIGVGINLSTTQFPEDIKLTAGSLGVEAECTAALCAEIANALFSLEFGGIPENVLEEYRKKSVVIGRDISYFINGQKFTARAISIDNSGGLVVESNGEIKTLNSGEITVRF
ncbi:MAG: biotin--[Clostridia bacterium]|nr:biotin--[acetyl-CoA-carboxylase] ligase [Clostridia bacterium]